MHEISVARLLGQLFTVTAAFQMPTQPQLLLLPLPLLLLLPEVSGASERG